MVTVRKADDKIMGNQDQTEIYEKNGDFHKNL